MRNPRIEEKAAAASPPSPTQFNRTLPVAVQYSWKLTNLDDPRLNAWWKERNRGKRVYVYPGQLRASLFELSPPVVAPAQQSVRLRIQFDSGYDASSEIRFMFYHEKVATVASDWFAIEPLEDHIKLLGN
jgi:hypothetical protein